MEHVVCHVDFHLTPSRARNTIAKKGDTMTRRQFIAACLILVVAVCLLDLDRLRKWWTSFGVEVRKGSTLTSFSDALKRLYREDIIQKLTWSPTVAL